MEVVQRGPPNDNPNAPPPACLFFDRTPCILHFRGRTEAAKGVRRQFPRVPIRLVGPVAGIVVFVGYLLFRRYDLPDQVDSHGAPEREPVTRMEVVAC